MSNQIFMKLFLRVGGTCNLNMETRLFFKFQERSINSFSQGISCKTPLFFFYFPISCENVTIVEVN